jgi:hypothetical protein
MEELEKAGERFLSDSKWNYCKDNLNLKYYSYMNESIKLFCEQNKIQMPKITSIDDIRNKLPEYYKHMIKDSQDSFKISLNNRLFGVMENKDTEINYTIDDGDFKNKEEFKKWISGIFIAPEIAVSNHHLSDGIATTKKTADYYFTNMNGEEQIPSQDPINVRVSGDHGQVFMVLHKKVFDKNYNPAYYTIVW